eukprot:GILJ01008681.1.p1 GENE.GILJ01008681.1~~GILJ01008681.1.p1  ORF type:complete len:560 (+),score=83.76 GILJ01008681.1:51-1730(+)
MVVFRCPCLNVTIHLLHHPSLINTSILSPHANESVFERQTVFPRTGQGVLGLGITIEHRELLIRREFSARWQIWHCFNCSTDCFATPLGQEEDPQSTEVLINLDLEEGVEALKARKALPSFSSTFGIVLSTDSVVSSSKATSEDETVAGGKRWRQCVEDMLNREQSSMEARIEAFIAEEHAAFEAHKQRALEDEAVLLQRLKQLHAQTVKATASTLHVSSAVSAPVVASAVPSFILPSEQFRNVNSSPINVPLLPVVPGSPESRSPKSPYMSPQIRSVNRGETIKAPSSPMVRRDGGEVTWAQGVHNDLPPLSSSLSRRSKELKHRLPLPDDGHALSNGSNDFSALRKSSSDNVAAGFSSLPLNLHRSSSGAESAATQLPLFSPLDFNMSTSDSTTNERSQRPDSMFILDEDVEDDVSRSALPTPTSGAVSTLSAPWNRDRMISSTSSQLEDDDGSSAEENLRNPDTTVTTTGRVGVRKSRNVDQSDSADDSDSSEKGRRRSYQLLGRSLPIAIPQTFAAWDSRRVSDDQVPVILKTPEDESDDFVGPPPSLKKIISFL